MDLNKRPSPYAHLIWDKHKGMHHPSDAVYCGRGYGSRYGNPFIVGTHGGQGVCCDLFDDWLKTGDNHGNPDATEQRRQLILLHVHELKNKNLLCWCRKPSDLRPRRCHCETLARLANGG